MNQKRRPLFQKSIDNNKSGFKSGQIASSKNLRKEKYHKK